MFRLVRGCSLVRRQDIMNYNIDTLVMTAMRDNNKKRPYLYVNPIQGKHYPVNPIKVKEMCSSLADKINYQYKGEKLLVVGFAETATGIAATISLLLKNAAYFITTTRENYEGEDYLYFTESHSHAVDQKVYSRNFDRVIDDVDRIVFIDDEITTGNTICKLIECIRSSFTFKNCKYTIASILNSTPHDRIKELQQMGIDCVYLCKIPYEYKNRQVKKCDVGEKMIDAGTLDLSKEIKNKYYINSSFDMRFANEMSVIRKSVTEEKNQVIKAFENEIYYNDLKNLLVLGSEEFMYPTIEIGSEIAEKYDINVKIHSTTRSPILVSDDPSYPLKSRYQIRSMYDEYRTTYVYNLTQYDSVILFTESNHDKNYDIIRALEAEGNTNIFVFEWTKNDEE